MDGSCWRISLSSLLSAESERLIDLFELLDAVESELQLPVGFLQLLQRHAKRFQEMKEQLALQGVMGFMVKCKWISEAPESVLHRNQQNATRVESFLHLLEQQLALEAQRPCSSAILAARGEIVLLCV